MSAIIKAVNDNGDLMRLAISSPGNDFRLGACEAPPSIMSVYLGDDMTKFLDSYKQGANKPYAPNTKVLDMGASAIPPIEGIFIHTFIHSHIHSLYAYKYNIM